MLNAYQDREESRTESAEPVVVCLSPAAVVGDAYQERRASLPPHRWTVLADRSPAGVRDAAARAEVIVGDWTGELGLTVQDLASASRCRAVLQPTAGYQGIDVDAARVLGIPVANAPGANAASVAEWAVMAMILASRNVVREDRLLRAGQWRMVEASDDGLHDLTGRTIGVIGFGAIGQGVAARLHGFGVSLLVFDAVSVDHEILVEYGARQVGLDDLCRGCQVLTLHVPLRPDTRHLIDRRRLELLGSDGILVNTSRGAVVDEDALYAMLATRGIAGAALDVFEDEPLAPGHRWAGLDNVLLSPHLSGSTIEARSRMIGASLDDLDRVLGGAMPRHVVNGVKNTRDA